LVHFDKRKNAARKNLQLILLFAVMQDLTTSKFYKGHCKAETAFSTEQSNKVKDDGNTAKTDKNKRRQYSYPFLAQQVL